MEMFEKSIQFKNWTSEVFVGQLGQETLFDEEGNRFVKYQTYEFQPGGVYNVPASQAKLFARQIAISELHKTGTDKDAMLSDGDVKSLMNKCFPGSQPDEVNTRGTFERIDDTEAQDAKGPKDANTAETFKEDEEDQNADDEKNNAGQPKFKQTPKKEDQYV